MYADDAAIFLNPVKEEVQIVADTLSVFGHASGLVVNPSKSDAFPIRCEEVDLQDVLQPFGCPINSFPCKYLGLPLHIRQLRRVDGQPLIDKVEARLPHWKGRFLDKAGHLRLLNSVLTSMSIHFMTVFSLKKWAIKKIDKIQRGFLWKGSAEANGGHCLVKWTKASRPKKFGGLGILDLDLFGRALRLRWLWLEWTDPDRPWAGTQLPCTDIDHQLFKASTVVTLGDGRKALFWKSSWLQGRAPMDIAPDLYKLAWRKGHKVRDDLLNDNWTRGLWRMNTVEEMAQFVSLWDMVQNIEFHDRPDEIAWRWKNDRAYSFRSAYLAQFNGVANMASYAISSSLILVIHDNMIMETNLIVLACLCRHF
jgi:hypothetical protein